MARPTKFTPQTIEKLTQAIRMGATYEHACKFAGISYQTFNEWREGRGYPQGTSADAKREFSDAIQKAEGEAVIGWLAKIEAAAKDGAWQAAAWKLERRYPKDYGRSNIDVNLNATEEYLAAMKEFGRGRDA